MFAAAALSDSWFSISGEAFVTVGHDGSPIVLSIENSSTNLPLTVMDDDVCTGVKRYSLTFTNSSSSGPYLAVADGERGTLTISITDGMYVHSTLGNL